MSATATENKKEDNVQADESITTGLTQEVESGVLQSLKAGTPYREISKKYPVNPKQIYRVKLKYFPEARQAPSSKKDEDHAIVFALLKKRTSLIDVVIQTKIDPDRVKEIFGKFEMLSEHNSAMCSIAKDRAMYEIGSIEKKCSKCREMMWVSLYSQSFKEIMRLGMIPIAHENCSYDEGKYVLRLGGAAKQFQNDGK